MLEIALTSTILILLAVSIVTPWYHIVIKDRDDPTIIREEGTYYLQEYQETEYYSDLPLVRTAPSYEPRSFIVFERVGILMDFELLLLLLAGTAIALCLITVAVKKHFMGFGFAVASISLTVIAVVWFSISISHMVEPMGLTDDAFWGDGVDMYRAATWGPSIGWFLALAAIPFEIGVAFASHKEWKDGKGSGSGQFPAD
jgi:hypothetical protein